MAAVEFVVNGTAAPQGSKTHHRFGPPREDNPRTMPWRGQVAERAAEAMDGRPLLDGVVELWVEFVFHRPKSHFRADGLVKPGAKSYVDVKPDLDKLVRAICDAITGVVLRDDKQVVRLSTSKVYGDRARARIRLTELGPNVTALDHPAWDEWKARERSSR